MEIKKVCVAGAGSMGRQIAVNAAVAGFQVQVRTSKPEDNSEWCRGFLEKNVAKGRYTADTMNAALDLLKFTASVEEAVKDCDLIIESVIEDENIKREFFTEAKKYVKPDTVITSNSSYLPSSLFVGDVPDPGRLANLHYFNPVMQMKLVEIAYGPHTCPETLYILKSFVTKIGKKSVVVHKEIEGFIVNRILHALQDEAYYLYGSGIASFEDIDTAVELGLNYPMGPFRLMDLTGIDVNYYSRKRKFEQTGLEEDRPPKVLIEKIEKGEFGRKTGKGWYVYD